MAANETPSEYEEKLRAFLETLPATHLRRKVLIGLKEQLSAAGHDEYVAALDKLLAEFTDA